MEPFFGHKRAKNDDKILEAALTLAQRKKMNRIWLRLTCIPLIPLIP